MIRMTSKSLLTSFLKRSIAKQRGFPSSILLKPQKKSFFESNLIRNFTSKKEDGPEEVKEETTSFTQRLQERWSSGKSTFLSSKQETQARETNPEPSEEKDQTQTENQNLSEEEEKRKSKAGDSSELSQWQLFKEQVYNHQYKVFLALVAAAGLGGYFYWHYFNVDATTSKNIEKTLQKDSQITKVLEAFLVRTIIDVLKSPEVMNNAIDFTQEVINQQAVHDELLKYLLGGLKDPVFLDQVKVCVKDMIVELLKDPEVQKDLIALFTVALDNEAPFPGPSDKV